MNAEKQIYTWINLPKNKDPHPYMGLINGELPATIEHIAPAEITLSFESDPFQLPLGVAKFTIHCKTIMRWIVIKGVITKDTGIPVYTSAWHKTKRVLIRVISGKPYNGVILHAERISFCRYRPVTGYISRSYRLNKNKRWVKDY